MRIFFIVPTRCYPQQIDGAIVRLRTRVEVNAALDRCTKQTKSKSAARDRFHRVFQVKLFSLKID